MEIQKLNVFVVSSGEHCLILLFELVEALLCVPCIAASANPIIQRRKAGPRFAKPRVRTGGDFEVSNGCSKVSLCLVRFTLYEVTNATRGNLTFSDVELRENPFVLARLQFDQEGSVKIIQVRRRMRRTQTLTSNVLGVFEPSLNGQNKG